MVVILQIRLTSRFECGTRVGEAGGVRESCLTALHVRSKSFPGSCTCSEIFLDNHASECANEATVGRSCRANSSTRLEVCVLPYLIISPLSLRFRSFWIHA